VSDRIPVAVLGAGGLIGQHFVRMLDDHPEFDLAALTGGERSARRPLGEIWQIDGEVPRGRAQAELTPTSAARLARAGIRVAFSGLPSGRAGAIERELVRRGIHVFSNASDHREEPGVPLLVPEVNGDHLLRQTRPGRTLLVTNPNCTATGLVLALAPIWRLLRPRTVHVATYQALSGAGLPGPGALATAANVVPFIAGEEEKVARESRILLGTAVGRAVRPVPVPFLANCARVGVRDGHLEAVTLECRRRPTMAQLRSAWIGFDPLRELSLPTAPHPVVRLGDGSDRPQPALDLWAGEGRARGMAVVVGRPRWEPPYLRFFVLSHNAVRGGAGGSVLNAEFALAKGRLEP
jgi:aspartate-semialdehyde dehydrogenase